MTTDVRGLEHVIAAGFTGVSLALTAIFALPEPNAIAALVATLLPTLALLGTRRSRREQTSAEFATDGGEGVRE